MSEIVLPNDTNTLGNLMGGRLLHLMDICAAISAQRHTNRVCVTAAVDNVEFHSPIRLGEIVTLESQVNRAFRTSMEVEINVWAENPRTQEKRASNRAYYTFVAVDEDLHAVVAPPIVAETDDEREAFDEAARRRELRLILAGRLDMNDAKYLDDRTPFSKLKS
jgi:acyl-CoA hydrolase